MPRHQLYLKVGAAQWVLLRAQACPLMRGKTLAGQVSGASLHTLACCSGRHLPPDLLQATKLLHKKIEI
jgi:hypothetical protein